MFSSRYNIFVDKRYIYNAYTTSLIEVSPIAYDAITNNHLDTFSPSQTDYLKSLGILTEKDPDLECKEQFLNSYMPFFLALTNDCNFSCPYCYESGREKGCISYLKQEQWDSFKQFIRSNIDQFEKRHVSIVLYGGEPLLNKPLINIIFNDSFFSENNITVGYTIITNGYYLTDDIYDTLDNVLSLQVTIDGWQEEHNNSRKAKDGSNSFATVYSNLTSFATKYPNKAGLRINVSSNSTEYRNLLAQLASDIQPRNLLSVSFSPIFSMQCSDDAVVEMSNERDLILQEYIFELQQYAAKLGFKVKTRLASAPCMYVGSLPGVVDEKLNTYECPGEIYSQPSGKITSDGSIVRNETYKRITRSCYTSCQYGPLCYGGCKTKTLRKGEHCIEKARFETSLPSHIRNLAELRKMERTYCNTVRRERHDHDRAEEHQQNL